LVVIAIIAILAAILFPVFGKAREKARTASCQSNLKQIGTALQMYSQDYDEHLPGFVNYGPPARPSSRNWRDLGEPYIKNNQVRDCPSHTGPPYNVANGRGGSYALNFISYAPGQHTPPGSNYGWTPNPAQNQTVHMAQAMHPATTIWVCDYSTGNRPDYPLISSGGDIPNWHQSFATDAFSRRHLDAIDFLFLDGHVKWVRPEKMPYNNYWFVEDQ
jgi:prepilin-type processing-associated H-X9-DG protein